FDNRYPALNLIRFKQPDQILFHLFLHSEAFFAENREKNLGVFRRNTPILLCDSGVCDASAQTPG
ncbi:MAG: hypothetical protein K2O15_12535, partial [Lachnospiraceae bacterium]|nr:hypothetical protein [Lachnospiraceae bacterium]